MSIIQKGLLVSLFLLLCENMNTEDVFMYVCMCVHLFASLFHRLFVWRQ